MEKTLHYPAKTFSDLFEATYQTKEEAPRSIQIHKDNAKHCHLSSFCSVNGKEFYYFYAKPRQEVVEAIEKHSIGIDYDEMYFNIVVRDDGTALVCAQNNKIIGGPWLALIDAKTVPTNDNK